ncbi:MAG: HAD-IIB family hydrolase [Mariniphaga sp.]|nr:HAD-IIB family hydrolase [Mariniphaga sp.]MDD4425350.1 HAD-IIB family hydrolase [Mariniphaga sp.]
MSTNNIKLVATDLDGTFLKNDRTISPGNLKALQLLGMKQIVRVVATGRNLRKVTEVIPREVPFDYIVYSSGAGIFNWQKQMHIFQQNMDVKAVNVLLTHFMKKKYSFCAFAAAPENHSLWYFKGKKECDEFNRYLKSHQNDVEPLTQQVIIENQICQFLLIIPEDDIVFEQLKMEIESQCEEIRVIRSSSPVTKGYIWLEVFHRNVSKGHGVRHICEMLSIHQDQTFGIGNDYNDLDLLHYTAHSFLTANAPTSIKSRFIPLPSNENDAFAHAVQTLFT